MLALDPDNAVSAFEALASAGYRPSVPVTSEQFADASTRAAWIRDKNMTVLNLFSDAHPAVSVDVFVEVPFDFDTEWKAAMRADVVAGVEAPFVSLDTLIEMKETAGRHRDLDDVQHLRWIRDEGNRDG